MSHEECTLVANVLNACFKREAWTGFCPIEVVTEKLATLFYENSACPDHKEFLAIAHNGTAYQAKV